MNKNEAEQLLKTALDNPYAEFRDGQWNAIDTLVNQRRKLLVVQRTGWGKSAVYFISARIFRDQGLGLTIIISPLLALMRNQIDSAQRIGVKAATINSANTDEWEDVIQQILNDQVDCLLISPERLANEEFIERVLRPIANQIALMVVDEAHCISDWGHDFRPDYRRIVSVLQHLPKNTPVLGTTATANDRVINDIQDQIGNIIIQRGSLTRESLALQTMNMPDQASRLAWLAKIIPTLEGTGIIYTLTTRDAEQVATWLVQNGVDARAYHGSITHSDYNDSNQYRQYLEERLLHNNIKVLVATSALGMGYDKPDLKFVIHYQAPNSVVSYYQQVGRAGRGINTAFGILMSGNEDNDIHDFFRRAAFPTFDQVEEILQILAHNDGMTVRQIEESTNLSNGQISKVLKLLSVENPAPLIKTGSRWQRTPLHYSLDIQRIEHLTNQREAEWQQMIDYIQSSSCLMNFLQLALDDQVNQNCGKCSNCLQQAVIPVDIHPQLIHQAGTFLRHAEFPIKPKKQVAANAFPEYGFRGNLPVGLQAQEGRVLSRWGDASWGKLIADNKHANHFSDELVNAVAEMIKNRWQPEGLPTWVCCVPSFNHPDLVPDFSRRLAIKLELPFVNSISKIKHNPPQKLQQNRFHQCNNLDGVFEINEIDSGSVLLVDDIVDSGWTLTVLAALLQQKGSGKVYPVALASTSTN